MSGDLLLAAAAAADEGWSATSIAAVVAAVGGALGGIFTGVRSLRSDKFKQNVEAGAALLSGYTDMVQTLRSDIDRLKAEHSVEREEWRVERERMKADHAEEVRELNERIDELASQVYALLHRPDQHTRTRSTDK